MEWCKLNLNMLCLPGLLREATGFRCAVQCRVDIDLALDVALEQCRNTDILK
jgi:hypothetical protein